MSKLILKNITKSFHQHKIVDDLNIDIQDGEFLTILGPSGCGKTTTLRMIAGFETPDSGEILLQGKNIIPIPPYRRNVNTVFQNYALFPHLNVRQNVAFGLEQKRMNKVDITKRVDQMLELVQMSSFRDRKPFQLSGGQQQRVAIARSLAPDPEVLLLDEPLGALDLKLRKQMQIELKSIHTELKRTFIYVTHDQEEAITMSDRIAVMNKGKIEQLSDSHTMYNYPTTKFVAGFIGEANLINVKSLDTTSIQLEEKTFFLHHEFKSNEKLILFIRPEHISFSKNPFLPSFSCNARIVETIFVGNYRKYVMKTALGQVIIKTEDASVPISNHHGDEVAIYLDSKFIQLFQNI